MSQKINLRNRCDCMAGWEILFACITGCRNGHDAVASASLWEYRYERHTLLPDQTNSIRVQTLPYLQSYVPNKYWKIS